MIRSWQEAVEGDLIGTVDARQDLEQMRQVGEQTHPFSLAVPLSAVRKDGATRSILAYMSVGISSETEGSPGFGEIGPYVSPAVGVDDKAELAIDQKPLPGGGVGDRPVVNRQREVDGLELRADLRHLRR